MGNYPKILVVDDEPANLQKLRRTLIGRYEVLSAANGKEGLEWMDREPEIAVFIVDQRMPDITGIELLRKTLERFPHAVRIILTGFTDVEVLLEAINSCKVYRYLVKPWDPPDLLITVERGLEAYRLAIENEQYRKELIRRERLARELEIAGDIQRSILPHRIPEIPGWEMAVEYHPAREVGGDFYDLHCLGAPTLLQLVIGDVSGKSIPAALGGAVFSGHLRALFPQAYPPGKLLAMLNSSLVERYCTDNHVAAAAVRLDTASGQCSLANGGMPFPFLVRRSEVVVLPAAGVPLGLFEIADFEEFECELRPGDQLIWCSDGISDCQGAQGEMYGEDRLQESLSRYLQEPLGDFLASIYREVLEFADPEAARDDITLIGLRRRTE